MADFFSSLLDRAFERAPVLQWRRPSRFEPVMGTRSMPDDGLHENTGPTQEDRTPVRTAQNRQDADAAVISSRHAPAPPEHGRQTAANLRDRNADSASALHAAPPEPKLDTQRDGRPVHKPLAPPASITHTEKVVIERKIEKESVRVQVAGLADASGARRAATPNRARLDAASAQIRPLTVPVKPPAPPAKANTGKREAKQDAAASPQKSASAVPAVPMLAPQARRPALSPMQAQRTRAPQSPPPIQVTIGRIEIRANTLAAPPRDTRPAAPRLSLEDYLRSRSGGGK